MLHRCPGRCRDLFDAPFFTRVGADRRSHEEQHDWKEMQGRNARSGRQEQAAQCFPHGFGETSTDSVDRIAQVGVGAAGNHQFEPRLVKRAVYVSQNEIDRDGTYASTGSRSIFCRISLNISSHRCSTAFANRSYVVGKW